MSSRVLLISVNRCVLPYPVYPLGVSHLGATLRREGHTVLLADVNCHGDRLSDHIKSFKPDLVGLSLRNIDTTQIGSTRFFVPDLSETLSCVKSCTNVPVVLGGSAYSLFPERILEFTGADYGIYGEGEAALCSLVMALETKKTVNDIAGLVYRDGTRIRKNQKNDLPIGQISAPILPEELTGFYLQKSLMLNIQTQRGCSYRCCYCTYPLIEGKKFRRRDPKAVADELASAQKNGCKYFFIVDSVFNTSNEHVSGICEEILRRGLELEWCTFLRPKGLTDEVMGLMKRAGLRHIEFGSDSLCDSVLEAYGKGFSFEDIYRANELAFSHGVRAAHFIIIGGPTETEATIIEGYQNSKRLRKTVFFPYVGMRVYPGTPLHEFAVAEGTLSPKIDLLPPYFYLSPHVSEQRIFELLEEFRQTDKNWAVNEPSEKTIEVMNGLRRLGVMGPLWEFIAR